MPGTAGGTVAFSARTVFSATSSTRRLLLRLLAGHDHVRLQDHAVERDAAIEQLVEDGVSVHSVTS